MNDNAFTLLLGDCRETLKTIPDGTVQCCVTSPPYFGLRDYGVDGQIGLEETPAEYVARLVEVFKEVRRVLRDDGTLWLNLGDSYARTGGTDRKVSASAKVGSTRNTLEQMCDRTRRAASLGLKHKDLIGIPWRVAFALQADGWYLRQDIIWHKPNPMPESVRDRCAKAHEYIFLLTKSPRYYFDAEAIKEPAAQSSIERAKYGYKHAFKNQFAGSPSDARHQDGKQYEAGALAYDKRNRRSVWTVATRPYKGQHFAVFPPQLIEPCILAGSRPGDIVLDPFGGSGTTAGVAIKHGRQAILCELNPDYAALVPERVASIVGLPAHDNDNDAQISMLEILEGYA